MPRQLNASECRALFPLIFVAGWLACAAVLAVAEHVDSKKHQANPQQGCQNDASGSPEHPLSNPKVGTYPCAKYQQGGDAKRPADNAGYGPDVESRLPDSQGDKAANQGEEARE